MLWQDTEIQCVFTKMEYKDVANIIIFSYGVFMSFKCSVAFSGSVQVVSQRLPFSKTSVHSNRNPYAICDGQNDTGTCFSASTSVWSCQ